jgi:hypothetical protein
MRLLVFFYFTFVQFALKILKLFLCTSMKSSCSSQAHPIGYKRFRGTAMIGVSKSHNSQMKASDNSILINPRKIYLSSFQTPVHVVSNFQKPFL